MCTSTAPVYKHNELISITRVILQSKTTNSTFIKYFFGIDLDTHRPVNTKELVDLLMGIITNNLDTNENYTFESF